jgi:hypothetical protein
MKMCVCVLLNDGNYQETLLVCRCLQTIRWGFAAVATFSAASFFIFGFQASLTLQRWEAALLFLSSRWNAPGTGVQRGFHVPCELNGELSEGFLN